MLRTASTFRILVSSTALALALATPNEAQACGGFFCSSVQPVNQAAERIIFADNGNGTVTAVIQILYEGPSEKFSWLLPLSTVPKQDSDIGIASNLAFQRLQSATNPQYSLNTRVEGTCKDSPGRGGGPVFSSGGTASVGGNGAESPVPSVVVEASGVVGAFEWAVISVNESLEDPADAATEWLTENGYDVPEGAKGLLRPYLLDNMYLLALRLTKGSTTGSIRPISLTYDADKPMIPIKLTAVAANEDMGVMTWLLSSARAVPQNYYSLELNEARINWFNANSNYNDVVNEAADDASGHGFVTELAGKTQLLKDVIWTPFEESQWAAMRSTTFANLEQLYMTALGRWGSYDGFDDAARSSIELPSNVPYSDFRSCPSCYADQAKFSPTEFFDAMEKQVIEPMRSVQKLIDSKAYVTRLYTTLSAMEMTEDPLFTFNPDLPDVSNLHVADRVIECTPEVTQFEAPFRIELPQGSVIRGSGAQAQSLTWPTPSEALPANRRVLKLSSSGEGKVVLDNTEEIARVTGNNLPEPNGGMSSGGAPQGGAAPSKGGSAPGGSSQGNAANGGSSGNIGAAGQPHDTVDMPKSGGSGCSVGSTRADAFGAEWLFAGLATGLSLLRRRRPRPPVH